MTKILIVEDEVSFSEALEFLLGKEGFSVVTADNGAEALRKFDQGGIDLVLLDLMIPQVSGTEVCRQIRSKSRVPIIMLTAKDSEVDKVVGLEIGADDYVTKPIHHGSSWREFGQSCGAILARMLIWSRGHERWSSTDGCRASPSFGERNSSLTTAERIRAT